MWNALSRIEMKKNSLSSLLLALIPNIGSKIMAIQTLEGVNIVLKILNKKCK